MLAFDQTLADIRAKKAKAEKQLANLDAPRLELERLTQQEAELEAQQAAAQAEVEQLAAEKAELTQDASDLAYATDVTQLIKALEPADRYRSRRHHSSVYSLAIAALRDDHETLRTYNQRLLVIERRLKELLEG